MKEIRNIHPPVVAFSSHYGGVTWQTSDHALARASLHLADVALIAGGDRAASFLPATFHGHGWSLSRFQRFLEGFIIKSKKKPAAMRKHRNGQGAVPAKVLNQGGPTLFSEAQSASACKPAKHEQAHSPSRKPSGERN